MGYGVYVSFILISCNGHFSGEHTLNPSLVFLYFEGGGGGMMHVTVLSHVESHIPNRNGPVRCGYVHCSGNNNRVWGKNTDVSSTESPWEANCVSSTQ